MTPENRQSFSTNTSTPDLSLICEKLALLDLSPRQRIVIDHLTSATREKPIPSTVLVNTLTQDPDDISDGRKCLSSIITNLKPKIGRRGIEIASTRLKLLPGDWLKGKARVGYYLVYNPELAAKAQPAKEEKRKPATPKPKSERSTTLPSLQPKSRRPDFTDISPKHDPTERLTQQNMTRKTTDALNHFALTLVSHLATGYLNLLSPHVQDVFPSVPGVQLTDGQIFNDFREHIERLKQTQQASSANEKKLIKLLNKLQDYGCDCPKILAVTARYFGLEYCQDPPPLPVISDTVSETSLKTS